MIASEFSRTLQPWSHTFAIRQRSHSEHVDGHSRGERRQAVWADTFRLVGAPRQLNAVQPPDAAFLIHQLGVGAGALAGRAAAP